MPIEIVKDYWQNVSTHDAVIRRAIGYWVWKKYPVTHKFEDAYNAVILKMYGLDLFLRFNPDRGKEDKSVEVKFEKFIFNWVGKILRDMHEELRRYNTIFCKPMPQDISSLSHRPRLDTDSSWDQEYDHEEPVASSMQSMRRIKSRRSANKKCRIRPGIESIRDFIGEIDIMPDESIREKELLDSIYSACRDSKDKLIVDLLYAKYYKEHHKESSAHRDIHKSLGFSNQTMSNHLKSIRKRIKCY